MDRQTVIDTLRAHQTQLQQLGVLHAALFGSVARGDAGPRSDIDIAIDIAEGAAPDMYSYAGLKRQIAELLPGSVDVVDRSALRSGISQSAQVDMIYAF